MTTTRPKSRKVKEGIVLSNKMQNTVTVKVERAVEHADFDKRITRAKKYYAHVENQKIEIGQRVKIEETRPISKLKRWRVIEVIS